MQRFVPHSPASHPPHAIPHTVATPITRIATLVATVAMLAILTAMVMGIRDMRAGDPLLMDDATSLVFATG